MNKLTLVLFVILSGVISARTLDTTKINTIEEKYQNIINIFDDPGKIKVNLIIDRPFSIKYDQKNPGQMLSLSAAQNNYLKIVDRKVNNDSIIEEKRYYFNPEGQLVLAEIMSFNKDKKTILYTEDNPILNMRSVWIPVEAKYSTSGFQKLSKEDENLALKLLKESVGFYNTTKEFLDNLPTN